MKLLTLQRPFLILAITCLQAFAAQATKKSSVIFPDSTGTDTMQLKDFPLTKSFSGNPSTTGCNTQVFFMRLSAGGGTKLILHEVQAIHTGGFVAVAVLKQLNGSEESILIKFDPLGNILASQEMRVNNSPVIMDGIKVKFNGHFIVSGIIPSTGRGFLADLDNLFTPAWIRSFSFSGGLSVLKTTLHLLEYNNLAFAIQATDRVSCIKLAEDGNVLWNRQVTSPGLTDILGFSNCVAGGNALATSHFRNGKYDIEVTDIGDDGTIGNSSIVGIGTEENKGISASFYSSRMAMLSIQKNSSGQFNVVRYITYGTAKIETKHLYQVPGNYDFNVSGTMDIAGDAMAVCTPGDGKLLFIKQIRDYQTTPLFTRQYSVPVGSSVISATRNRDAGYLFGLNTLNNGEVIFIKTDSVGNLPGCGATDLPISFTENTLVNNQPVLVNVGTISAISANATAAFNPVTLSKTYDCKQTFCPVIPPTDSCQASYYKILRSQSFYDGLGQQMLMRGDKQIFSTARLERILEQPGENPVTMGLKVFDQAGNFIKGISIFENNRTTISGFSKMSDSTILAASSEFVTDHWEFTFRLFSDNLDVVWSRRVKAPPGFEMYSGGSVIGDLHMDSEGNYYLCGTSAGFMEAPRIMLYKMDPLGNPLWIRSYNINAPNLHFINISMTSSSSSIHLFAEGAQSGGVSATMNKSDGLMTAAYQVPVNSGGTLYRRALIYDQGQLFYGGETQIGFNSRFAMVLLDTTGKPIRAGYLEEASGTAAIDVKHGKLFASAQSTVNNGSYVLMKIDTAFNILFANQYSFGYNFSYSLQVAPGESIYAAGNLYDDKRDHQYALLKYDPAGRLNSCPSVPQNLSMTPIPLTGIQHPFSLNNVPDFLITIDPGTLILPDTFGLNVSTIVCSANVSCNLIEISGPTSVCQINTNYTFPYKRNPGCNIRPECVVDTATFNLVSVTENDIIVSFKKPGSTWLKLKLYSGCKIYMDSLLVNVQASNSFSLGKDTSFCNGDTLLLQAPPGFSNYLWQNGAGTSFIKVTTPGTYSIMANNACGEILRDTVEIGRFNIPALTLGNDLKICRANTVLINSVTGFANYQWASTTTVIGQGAAVKIKPLQSGQLTLLATTADGCKAKDTLDFTVIFPKPVSLGTDTSFCAQQSIILNAGTGYTNYTWSTGGNSNSITVSSAGTYSVEATDVNGCIARDTLKVISVYPLPLVNLGNDAGLCIGDTKRLDAGIAQHYLWQDNSINRYFSVSGIGKYFVRITDAKGCRGSDTIEIKNIFSRPADFLIASSDSICSFEKVTISAKESYLGYRWSDGSISPQLIITKPGIYSLSATDRNGCEGKDTINIFSKTCLSGLYIPTAFTPGNNRINDQFKALTYGPVLNYRMKIFNRYGELVFFTTEISKGWNGKYKGLEQNAGAFVWECTYTLPGQSMKTKHGTVLLLR